MFENNPKMLDKCSFEKQILILKRQKCPQNQSEKLNGSQKLQISMTTRKRGNFEKQTT